MAQKMELPGRIAQELEHTRIWKESEKARIQIEKVASQSLPHISPELQARIVQELDETPQSLSITTPGKMDVSQSLKSTVSTRPPSSLQPLSMKTVSPEKELPSRIAQELEQTRIWKESEKARIQTKRDVSQSLSNIAPELKERIVKELEQTPQPLAIATPGKTDESQSLIKTVSTKPPSSFQPLSMDTIKELPARIAQELEQTRLWKESEVARIQRNVSQSLASIAPELQARIAREMEQARMGREEKIALIQQEAVQSAFIEQEKQVSVIEQDMVTALREQAHFELELEQVMILEEQRLNELARVAEEEAKVAEEEAIKAEKELQELQELLETIEAQMKLEAEAKTTKDAQMNLEAEIKAQMEREAEAKGKQQASPSDPAWLIARASQDDRTYQTLQAKDVNTPDGI
jgi:hypothetical protein